MLEQTGLCMSEEDKQIKQEAFEKLKERYRGYRDPWGFNIETVHKAMDVVYPFYKKYFRVRVFGAENIKNEPYIFASNHTGQLPIDGALIMMAAALETDPPRILHSMVDRFMAKFPFLGDVSAQAGSILGDRTNCKWLLERNESILVFPEGMKGISKNTNHYYELQQFTNGFYRIALDSKTKILPVTVVGAEEMYPFVFHAKKLGKALGLPTLPVSANLFPLPSPIDIYFGEPVTPAEGVGPEDQDKIIRPHVHQIEKIIKKQLAEGLKNQRPFFDAVKKPIREFLKKRKQA